MNKTPTSAAPSINAATLSHPLVLLNLALLCTLLFIMRTGEAQGQNAHAPTTTPAAPAPPGARARGEYTMVAGRTNSGGADAIYILDASNQEVLAMRWDGAKQALNGIGYRSLTADSKSLPGR